MHIIKIIYKYIIMSAEKIILKIIPKTYYVDADGEFELTVLNNMIKLARTKSGQHILKNNKLLLNNIK